VSLLKKISTFYFAAFAVFLCTEAMAADTQMEEWVTQSDILQRYIADNGDTKISSFLNEGKRRYAEVFEEREIMIATMQKRMMDKGIEQALFDLALITRFDASYYEPAKAIGEAISLCLHIKKRLVR
jgi:hypothetical protein